MIPNRTRVLIDRPVRTDADFVLYWMTSARRTRSNFALERAADLAREHRKPLVVLEPLRAGYRWANDRIHRFIVDGMAENARRFARTPVTYVPFVERTPGAGKGLVRALSRHAAVVVTDDYPAFFLPRMLAAATKQIDARFEAVDTNGIAPMRTPQRCFTTAFSFRSYLQKSLRDHITEWPADIVFDDLQKLAALPREISARWPPTPIAALESPARLIGALPIDHSVSPLDLRGGARPAAVALASFIADVLPRYGDDRNQPSVRGTSRLSPYLHFGHISAHDVFSAVMNAEKWTTRKLARKGGGAREGWWGVSANAEGFLDQLITWRELGFNMCVERPKDFHRYGSLPEWARTTLEKHADDQRPFIYTRAQFESADTHDPVWNAAQRELLQEGWMHNYMRMLWGKKILEWTRSPEEAIEVMTEIMNKHAIDGRDPNSYTGYFWTLGRYDRPWAPERPVFGSIRYMTSGSTVKKLRMKPYLAKYGESPNLFS